MITVGLISARVIVFRGSYIITEKFFSRFILLVMLFISRIFLLIFSPNLIRILLGWDGLGVSSYLLVIFYQRSKSFNAGILTALTNRLGDVGILLRIGLITTYGSWNTFIWGGRRFGPPLGYLVVILIATRITKSAQIPFSAWLPAAIAAPTPVSALVHSSTLVTAGVYLLIRFGTIISSSNILGYLLLIGTLTIFMAGLVALYELDIKKIIALSTLRQLGVIMIILGTGLPLFSFFHLLAHAYFKAILFMCAGTLIHRLKDYQDIRTIGQSQQTIPLTTAVLAVANLRLCGLPFMSGFYSKDLILERIMTGPHNLIVISIAIVGTAFTVLYSVRITFLVFATKFIGEVNHRSSERDSSLSIRILLLLLPATVGGLLLSWALFPRTPRIILPIPLKRSILIIILLTRGLAIFESIKNEKGAKTPQNKINFWGNCCIWFLPYVGSPYTTNTTLIRSKSVTRSRDHRWNERILYKFFYGLLSSAGMRQDKSLSALFSQSLILGALSVLILAT